ncbi:cytochrome P450 [Nocardia sp. NBC_01327]|uniref:cytochrome P450 n=1 Tax=Nocardia sp. NBC_01327 TaxID=2903593 RepID=UPI002E157DD9|nr:cytochrome P450 [Nocardia sp. NBC_01327]
MSRTPRKATRPHSPFLSARSNSTSEGITKKPNTIPRAPGAMPLIGHTLSVLHDPWSFVAALATSDDKLVRVSLGPLDVVVVCDPELTRQVLHDDRTFDKGGPVFDVLRKVIGTGLGSCPHSLHRRQRRLIQPGFNQGRIAAFTPTIVDEIETMTSSWRHGQILDVPSQMLELTIRTIMAAMFSDALPPAAVRIAMSDVTTLFNGLYSQLATPSALRRLPIPGNRRYRKANTRLRATLAAIITDRRTAENNYDDLLATLLSAHDNAAETDALEEGKCLNDAEISDQAVTFFMAGSETTAAVLGWALHLLALHPDIEERLHIEVDRVLAGGAAHFVDVPKLELTRNIITETLRLYPAGWLFTRTVAADTRLGEYALPPGTTVVYSSYLIHHRADLYDAPERFDPDRWSSERAVTTPGAYIPFGRYARKCIGDNFALTEAVLALATITAHWELRHIPGKQIQPAKALTLRPRNLHMRVAARRTMAAPKTP